METSSRAQRLGRFGSDHKETSVSVWVKQLTVSGPIYCRLAGSGGAVSVVVGPGLCVGGMSRSGLGGPGPFMAMLAPTMAG